MELIRTGYCELSGTEFTLRLYDTYETDRLGKHIVRYVFTMGDNVIFDDRLHCSPLHAIDSDECVRACLDYISLRPGDTDREFFADYTPAQHEFADMYAEELQCMLYADEDLALD
jgi:hypothetical protein